jgi:hypothetical protein
MKGTKNPIIVKNPETQSKINVGLFKRDVSTNELKSQHDFEASTSSPPSSLVAVWGRVTDAWYAKDV